VVTGGTREDNDARGRGIGCAETGAALLGRRPLRRSDMARELGRDRPRERGQPSTLLTVRLATSDLRFAFV
jgi:hypothetical protein